MNGTSTITKIIGAGVVTVIGVLLLSRKTKASGGCNDEEGIRAWTIQENLSVILVKKKSDFVATSEPIDAIVVTDSCEVYEYSTTQSMYVVSPQLTNSLRDFLRRLIRI